ncbi:MAG TPA: outer membrane beta-barrel protein [Vicinamibacterales bacterium]|nr:outer membrane beta-barrel protein [Vicinamibacterales bacterium]
MTPRFRTALRTVAAFVAAFLFGIGAQAQSPVGPPENVRMRLGPVFLDPTISITNAGIDDNVFNDPKSASPTSDATVTATPKTDFWVRFGSSWLSGTIREDLVYYKDSVSQRSADNTYSLTWMIPFNRITFRPTATYVNTRERPGYEIDTRAPHTDLDYAGEVDVKWFSKSAVVVKAGRHQEAFEQGITFEDVDLHDALNRNSTLESVSLEYHVTPLTTMTADYSLTQDRFTYDAFRNANSTTIGGSVRFDPAALIKGTASIGYQDYRPIDPSTPGYKGITAVVGLSYVFLGTTKVAVNATRGVQYSYDINQPYYIQTGGTASIAQQLYGPFDVTALAGLYGLAYRNRAGAVVVDPDRTDRMQSIGGGIGYHLGRDMRLGFTVEQDRRQSPIASHEYTGLRYGFSVTYGSS